MLASSRNSHDTHFRSAAALRLALFLFGLLLGLGRGKVTFAPGRLFGPRRFLVLITRSAGAGLLGVSAVHFAFWAPVFAVCGSSSICVCFVGVSLGLVWWFAFWFGFAVGWLACVVVVLLAGRWVGCLGGCCCLPLGSCLIHCKLMCPHFFSTLTPFGLET